MKNLTQIAALSLLLGLVIVFPATAEMAESSTAAVTTELSNSTDVAPSEMPPRPDPVFLAGTNAGGAGGLKTGLVNGESSSLPGTGIFFEDHLCCQVGAGCDCVYWPGRNCQPIGCPAYNSPPNC